MKRALTIVAALLVLLCNTQALLAACMCPPPVQEMAMADGMPCHVEAAALAPAMDTCCHETQSCAASPRHGADLSDPVWIPAMAPAPPPAMAKLVAMPTPAMPAAPPLPSAPIYLVDCCFLN